MSKEVEEPGENWASNQGDLPPKIIIPSQSFYRLLGTIPLLFWYDPL